MKTAITARWTAIVGYLAAAVILLGSQFLDWTFFVFPTWVLVVSVNILIEEYRKPAPSSAPGQDQLARGKKDEARQTWVSTSARLQSLSNRALLGAPPKCGRWTMAMSLSVSSAITLAHGLAYTHREAVRCLTWAAACIELVEGSRGERIVKLKLGEPMADTETGGLGAGERLIGPKPLLRAPIADLVEERNAEIVVRSNGAEKALVGRKGPVRLQRLMQGPIQHVSHLPLSMGALLLVMCGQP